VSVLYTNKPRGVSVKNLRLSVSQSILIAENLSDPEIQRKVSRDLNFVFLPR